MRPYIIPVAEIKPGDILVPDADFTCMEEGDHRVVYRDNWFKRNLPASILALFGAKPSDKWPLADTYVLCDEGRHYLDGQRTDDGAHVKGFIKAETPPELDKKEHDDRSDQEIVSCEAELTEAIDGFEAGHRFTIMAVEDGKLRLLDDEGNVVLTERSKIKVIEW